MMQRPATGGFEAISKPELHRLADGLLRDDETAIERCIAFILEDSKGLWHGRARAMMCRRLKHCSLRVEQRERLKNSKPLSLLDQVKGLKVGGDYSAWACGPS